MLICKDRLLAKCKPDFAGISCYLVGIVVECAVWENMKVVTWFLFAAAVLAGLALALFAGRPVSDPAPLAAKPAPAEAAREPTRQQGSIGATPSPRSSVGMRKRFEQAPNYAAFIQDAMERPDEGGRFYALIAWNRCVDIDTVNADPQAPLTGSAERRAQAEDAIADLQRRCSGVKAQFPDELSFMRAMKLANSRGKPDLLLIERGALLSRTSREAASGDIARAVGTGDPYLIAATVEINVGYFAEKIDPRFINDSHRQLLYLAAAAMSCEVVGNCNSAVGLLTPCVAGGFCAHADYRDLLRDDLDQDERALFEHARKALLRLAGRGG